MGIKSFFYQFKKSKPESPLARPPSLKQMARAFAGAKGGRLNADWQAWQTHIDWDIYGQLRRLRARARDLEQNNPVVVKYLALVTQNVVGTNGFRLQVRGKLANGTQDSRRNDQIEDAFYHWAFDADLTGIRSLQEIQRAVIMGVARDGESLVRLHETALGLRLEILDPERLDLNKNGRNSANNNPIRLGIEYNSSNQPVNYYLLHRPEQLSPTGISYDQKHEVIPAQDIIHVYKPDRPEQGRGYPWIAPVMDDLHMLQGYQEAALVAAREGASKMGFFTTPDGMPGALGQQEQENSDFLTETEPGVFGILPTGYKFESYNPDYPAQAYPSFIKEIMRRISGGLNVAYNSLANDLEGVSFSSIRSGVLEERDHWMRTQNWFGHHFMRPIYRRWLLSALLRGDLSGISINQISRYQSHEWAGRRWSWVDPLRDIESSAAAIALRVRTRAQVCGEQGLDFDDVVKELAAEEARIRELGLETPSVPAKPKEAAKTNE